MGDKFEAPATLYPRNIPLQIEQKAELAPEPIFTFRRRHKTLTPAGIRTLDLSGRSSAAVPTTVSRLTKLKCSRAEICALLGFDAAFGSFYRRFGIIYRFHLQG